MYVLPDDLTRSKQKEDTVGNAKPASLIELSSYMSSLTHQVKRLDIFMICLNG